MVKKNLWWYLDKFEEKHDNLFFMSLMLFLYIIFVIITIIGLLLLTCLNININPSQPFADNVFCISLLLYMCFFVYGMICGMSNC